MRKADRTEHQSVRSNPSLEGQFNRFWCCDVRCAWRGDDDAIDCLRGVEAVINLRVVRQCHAQGDLGDLIRGTDHVADTVIIAEGCVVAVQARALVGQPRKRHVGADVLVHDAAMDREVVVEFVATKGGVGRRVHGRGSAAENRGRWAIEDVGSIRLIDDQPKGQFFVHLIPHGSAPNGKAVADVACLVRGNVRAVDAGIGPAKAELNHIAVFKDKGCGATGSVQADGLCGYGGYRQSCRRECDRFHVNSSQGRRE
mmetsp:Transcript_5355/g.8429  ORF Transcript_5355/g.8429 Transcript_5355/m.8429 type:complete len:256 (-) Transcript_5355:2812-3579(-)